VGDYVTNTNQSDTLIEFWDGTTWSVVPSPNASSINGFSGVSCVSTSSCTAVGDFNSGTVTQTLIETLNGTTWSVVASPDSSSSDSNGLDGVSCPLANSGTCTAVGIFQKDNGPGPAHGIIAHDVELP
jgi:hypothetical protein